MVGTEGEQGHANGAHLHLEVRRGGAVMNPITYLEQQGVPIRCSPQMVNNWADVPAGGLLTWQHGVPAAWSGSHWPL